MVSKGQDDERQRAIERFRRWLWDTIRTDSKYREKCRELSGKVAMCHCAPSSCHGEFLKAGAAWCRGR